jgi:uncharacterized protein YjbJ (UPF0337 family)
MWPARRPLAEQTLGAVMGINKDQVEGRLKEAGGKIQEEFGKAVGNTAETIKGKFNKNVGAAQATLGDVTERAKDNAKNPDRRP